MRNRLRELREDQGWSQGELAERLEVSRQTVNALETGKYDPSLPLAFRIARLFALRIEDVFDPDAHRWLRLLVDAMSETVEVQTSPDRSTWTSFDVVDASPMDLFSSYAIVAGGAYEGLHIDDSLLAFDNAWMCLSGEP